jgi:hypothetical protein
MESWPPHTLWLHPTDEGHPISNTGSYMHLMLPVELGLGSDRQAQGVPVDWFLRGSRGMCKVAWPSVCRPTTIGGLGVLDLQFFGLALRLRWEWLSKTSPDCYWSSLPSTPENEVAAMATASIKVVLGNMEKARFWTDNWSEVRPLC